MCFSTIFTALFYSYIAHERTAQNLDFVSSLVALILIERLAPKLKVRARVIEQFQRAMRPALHSLMYHTPGSKHLVKNSKIS